MDVSGLFWDGLGKTGMPGNPTHHPSCDVVAKI